MDAPSPTPSDDARRPRRPLLSIAVVLLLAIVAAPYIIALTPLRNWVVGLIVDQERLDTKVGGASLGWITPVELRDVELSSGERFLSIGSLRTEAPWWRLAFKRQNLGHVDVDRPRFTVRITSDGSLAVPLEPTGRPPPEFDASIHDAGLDLRLVGAVDPVIVFTGLDADAAIRGVQDDRVLELAPLAPLEHAAITPEMCRQGLGLVAPVLAGATMVEGDISLRLDTCRVPIGHPEEADVRGRLTLHHVEAGIATPVLRRMAEVLASMVTSEPDHTIRLVNESEVEFRVDHGRVYHDGLAFGLPNVGPGLVLRTRGSVGFDQTLDLTVEIPVPQIGQGELAARLSSRPLALSVTGTFEEPIVGLAEDAGPLGELVTSLRSEEAADVAGGAADLASTLSEVVATALEKRRERADGSDGPTLLERLRARRAERRAADNDGTVDGTVDGEAEPRREPIEAEEGPTLIERLRARRDERRGAGADDSVEGGTNGDAPLAAEPRRPLRGLLRRGGE